MMQSSPRKGKVYIWCANRALLFKEETKFLQPASRIQCNIAFGELVVNFSDSYISNSIDTVVPLLIDMLRDHPFLTIDKTLSWNGNTNPPYYRVVMN